MTKVIGITRKDSKIRWTIILAVFIQMMDHFFGIEVASQYGLHHQTMFEHIALFGRMWMVWGIDIPIAFT